MSALRATEQSELPFEKRTERRIRTLLMGMIFEGQLPRTYCFVQDLSSKGAQLWIAELSFPQTFGLVLPTRDLAFDVEVRWQKGTHCGVQFGQTRPDLLENPFVRAARDEEDRLRGNLQTD